METKQIHIDKIDFPKNQPRKEFKRNSLEELAQSIGSVGLQQSIKIRPTKNKRFELVFGERRLRAHQLLKLKTIRADIEVLTDDKVKEIRLIENLQREDVHPLDEAKAIGELLEKQNTNIGTICGRTGKPGWYIAQRVQLLKLNKDVVAVYKEGRIELGHALLIAKMQPADQQKCLKYLETNNYLTPVERLKYWIRDHQMINLNTAPFDTKNKLLIEAAGSCIDCPKRSGKSEDLFPEVSGANICTDAACYKAKINAHTDLKIHQAEVEEKPLIKVEMDLGKKTKSDVLPRAQFQQYIPAQHKAHKDKVERAIVVAGPEKGKLIPIIRNEHLIKPESPAKIAKAEKEGKQKELDDLNRIINEERVAGYRLKLKEFLLQKDLKGEILLPIIRSILNMDVGSYIPEYFLFSWLGDAKLEFDKWHGETLIENFNRGVIEAAGHVSSNFPLEFLYECAYIFGTDKPEIKQLRKEVDDSLPLKTINDLEVKEESKG